MLYREFRSSQRSYYKNGASTNRYGQTDDRTGNRRHTMGTAHQHSRSHRKGNSVMVMSTSQWQESQEALQRDLEAGAGEGSGGSQTGGTASRSESGVRSPPHVHHLQGITKTREVTVETSPGTPHSSAADSFEMVSFEKERL